MTLYNIAVIFKNNKSLVIECKANLGLRKKLASDFANPKENYLWIEEYMIAKNEILYIRVKGEKDAKPSGKER